ncbi:MAG: ribosome hibernation-promoting factor, HPF/YfiA family [Streptosporangiaceae bacterium]
MDIIFRGRRTGVPERFRDYATAKLGKIVKLDQKTISIDVEVTLERNPRRSAQRERVELTVYSRGPVVRAEAAADDRYQALDRALAKLETHVRRACDRRKARKPTHGVPAETAAARAALAQSGDVAAGLAADRLPAGIGRADGAWPDGAADADLESWPDTEVQLDAVVPIPMEGDGPLVVREKFHSATPMTIDRALHEMELVGHDFFLFRDEACRLPSVVYRRRGYDYGVIRLVEEASRQPNGRPGHSWVGMSQPVGENRVTR